MIVVANAGPLIALGRIDRLDLLGGLFEEVRIPGAVADEVIGTEAPGRAGAATAARAPWLRRGQVCDVVAVSLLRERLGAGESEAVVLALELGADLLLIDEARGRRVAEGRGLQVLGTLGLLLVARQHALLPAVGPLIDELETAGFRMTPQLRREILAAAGEPFPVT